MNTPRNIPFSPPDITEVEIEAMADALRSGWITTGPRTKQFEQELADFCDAERVACFSSATAALECCLRALGIGPGDEVITSAYTYTASCSVIVHVGATPVLCDTAPGSYEMNYEQLASLVTSNTKAIIPVDIGGRMCDYDRLFAVLDSKSDCWQPREGIQSSFDRVPVLSDGAHSLGATYHKKPSGSVADFTAFSLHAVKNVTTVEGGALAWRKGLSFDSDNFYQLQMELSLHGQTKDALAKSKIGGWEYDIVFPGWKCNMTDVQAALGLVQLGRYPDLLARRHEIVKLYEAGLADVELDILAHEGIGFASSCHLMLVRLLGRSLDFRNALIEYLAERGIASNVHYKPLPLLTAYKDLGFDIADFPHAFEQYHNEITLPLHTKLSDEDIAYVCECFIAGYNELSDRGLA